MFHGKWAKAAVVAGVVVAVAVAAVDGRGMCLTRIRECGSSGHLNFLVAATAMTAAGRTIGIGQLLGDGAWSCQLNATSGQPRHHGHGLHGSLDGR